MRLPSVSLKRNLSDRLNERCKSFGAFDLPFKVVEATITKLKAKLIAVTEFPGHSFSSIAAVIHLTDVFARWWRA